MKKYLFLLLLLPLLACEQKPETAEETPEATLTEDELWEEATQVAVVDERPLSQRLDSLHTQLIVTWKDMESAEAQKIEDLQLLVAELPKLEGFSRPRLVEEMERQLGQLKALAFAQEKIMQPGYMNEYDKLLTEIEESVKQVMEETPELERYPELQAAAQNLAAAEQQDLMRRLRYEGTAKEYNVIIKTEADSVIILGQQDEKYRDLQEEPTFQYEEPAS